MRNHNTEGTPDQDPAADMFSDVEKKAMLSALRLRYTLLPHLYTLLASAHVNGTTVARPLWFEYPMDQSLYGNDKQLMWGDSIMVAPVLDKGATSVTAYFPADTWVDYATGDIITSSGQTMTVNAALDKIPVYVRAGGIIPLQSPDVTTTKSRLLPFALYAVLDKTGQACGSLYWDDGETLDAAEKGYYNLLYFTIKDNKLTSSYDKMGYSTNMKLDTVFLNNVNQTISAATVNGATAVVTKTNSVRSHCIAKLLHADIQHGGHEQSFDHYLDINLGLQLPQPRRYLVTNHLIYIWIKSALFILTFYRNCLACDDRECKKHDFMLPNLFKINYAMKLEISINFIDLIILYLTDSNIKVSNFAKSHMY
ncbi:hypothetical protein EB796_002547 [Bugula neritina]|uniref:Uncharacterized protein n=1 Tax=Bugula neritina TaxID=10212 RepID=A0A7J7KLW4_BUGNE|nr:hypothetical protein EB796_002547 [Bugula neritina]